MPDLLLRRFFAALFDYIIIVIYIIVLFGMTSGMYHILDFNPADLGPMKGQVIGFVSLTLPVFLYFTLRESGPYKATIGKKRYNLKVESEKNKFMPVLIRNVLKFIPWELGHTGGHWIYYFSTAQEEVPIWVFAILITAQLLGLLYFIVYLIRKGEQSLYDILAGTRVVGMMPDLKTSI